ncbi:unnamed protein product [Closterium sp. Yama58-4]|nr:unnamed protein product [Closterium sp. Yama58-4]
MLGRLKSPLFSPPSPHPPSSLQLTEGNTWLYDTLGVTPTNSWAIDPFGHSATMPYLLKRWVGWGHFVALVVLGTWAGLSGFANMLIQRTHYEVKKALAKQKHLEFFWRQAWDQLGGVMGQSGGAMGQSGGAMGQSGGAMGQLGGAMGQSGGAMGQSGGVMGDELMQGQPRSEVQQGRGAQGGQLTTPCLPLSSFFFLSVPQLPLSLHFLPRSSSFLLFRHPHPKWRKKSLLFRTNVLLVPLGDDFRYSSMLEAHAQFHSYELLFAFINSRKSLKVNASFGTLDEYFTAMRADEHVTAMRADEHVTAMRAASARQREKQLHRISHQGASQRTSHQQRDHQRRLFANEANASFGTLDEHVTAMRAASARQRASQLWAQLNPDLNLNSSEAMAFESTQQPLLRTDSLDQNSQLDRQGNQQHQEDIQRRRLLAKRDPYLKLATSSSSAYLKVRSSPAAPRATTASRTDQLRPLLPSLSGDFFTYADRDHDYWSGFFSSRPFWKAVDRALEASMRAADMLYALCWADWMGASHGGSGESKELPFPLK